MAVVAGAPAALLFGSQATSLRELGGAAGRTEPTVDDLLARGTVVCSSGSTLSDAVDLMVMHDRTSAAVVDEAGRLVGVLTENDILRAYVRGDSTRTLVSDWLDSGFARLPSGELPSETVRPESSLAHAAAVMRAHCASDGACHHLVILGDDGRVHGILSSLDLAQALCRVECDCPAVTRISSTAVEQVMKPKEVLPACSLTATLVEVFETIDDSHQNCVLITDGRSENPRPLGIVTPRDALRAFSEHVPRDLDVGHWLRGLQPEWGTRAVNAGTTLADAASKMATNSLHHILVWCAESSQFAGVLSTSDLARAIEIASVGSA